MNRENAVLRECALAFTHCNFRFVDFLRLNSDGCKFLYEAIVSGANNETGLIWRNNTGTTTGWKKGFMKFGLPGSCDIIGFTRDGRWIGWEVKEGKNVLSPVQKAFHAVAQSYNVLIGVGNSYESTIKTLKLWGF